MEIAFVNELKIINTKHYIKKLYDLYFKKASRPTFAMLTLRKRRIMAAIHASVFILVLTKCQFPGFLF